MPGLRRQRGYPARLSRQGATSSPTLRTAPSRRGSLGTSHRTPRPRPPPPWPEAPLAPPAGPARRSQRSSRFPGNQSAAAGFADQSGARAATPPTPQQPDPRSVPATAGRARPRKPIGATGRPATDLEEGTLLPAVGSAATRQRRSPGNRGSYTRGRKPKGLVTAPGVHRAALTPTPAMTSTALHLLPRPALGFPLLPVTMAPSRGLSGKWPTATHCRSGLEKDIHTLSPGFTKGCKRG